MKTVLHIIDTGGSGGAETVFLHTATGIDAQRFRSVCIVGSDGWLAARLRERGVTPLIVPAKGSFNVAYLRQLQGVVRTEKADVIVAHLYGSAIYGSLAGILCRKPVISVLHGQSDVDSRARFASVKSFIVRKGSRKVVFVSENLRNDLALKLGLNASKCAVVPNGVDLDMFFPGCDSSVRSELRLPPDAILVGSVGNIRGPKAYDVLLRAAALIAGRSKRFHFAIAGELSGKLAENLLQLRSELQIDDRVTFLGLRSDVANVIRNFDVFALSSRTEGFSIACIEAMACGVPVVATRSGGPQEILDGGLGYLVPVNDAAQLADAIQRMGEAPERRAELAKSALERVRDRYSLAGMLRRYDELLDLLSRAPARIAQ